MFNSKKIMFAYIEYKLNGSGTDCDPVSEYELENSVACNNATDED